MPSKPVQRSLKALRDDGWTVGIVERFIWPIKKRIDLFGFGDILAFRNNETVLVQCCREADRAAHRVKIFTECSDAYRAWVRNRDRTVFLDGWKLRPKGGVRGARKTWELRREVL